MTYWLHDDTNIFSLFLYRENDVSQITRLSRESWKIVRNILKIIIRETEKLLKLMVNIYFTFKSQSYILSLHKLNHGVNF